MNRQIEFIRSLGRLFLENEPDCE